MKDRISQLMDGELDERGAAAAIDALRRDADAVDAWRTYHVISDALRDTPPLSEGFAARFAERFAAEPTVLAPLPRPARARLLWAAAASLAAVALVAWLAFAPPPQPTTPQVAQATLPAAAAKPPVLMTVRATNDYLLAHQSFSPRLYLQGMAPYVRTVSEPADEPAR